MTNNSFNPLPFLSGLLLFFAAVFSSENDPNLARLGTMGVGLILMNLARKE
jgi:hypothetical protein